MVSPRDLKPTFEEDVAEPMRLIPFAPSIVIACWIVLLLGVSLAAWNAPII
jgi:prepilin signal peptidase PulO-like enzyme (type II secretory pathway)